MNVSIFEIIINLVLVFVVLPLLIFFLFNKRVSPIYKVYNMILKIFPLNIRRKFENLKGMILLSITIFLSFIFLIIFLVIIFIKGAGIISIRFLTQFPDDGMTSGGILPAIWGTFWLTILSILFSFPLGVLTAIYLIEYAKPKWLVNIIRLAINTLAGVPSIVFGLFGLAVFVVFFGFGESILAGSMTLAILILPIIINSSEEAIKSVPKEFREASLGLGATKKQTILKIVIPSALPSILTGAIISVGRAAGETAPILFTAGAFFTGYSLSNIDEKTLALPYHIYALVTEGTNSTKQVPIAYATAIVLLVLVLGINLIAIILRFYMRRNKKW